MPAPIVYVSSPLGQRTAGPEALTQFVDALRRRGIESYLIPMRTYRGNRNDPEYDGYDFEVATDIQDPENAVLVMSEVSPIETQRELSRVPRESTWLGWFSVSNCPDPRARYYRPSEACCSTFPPGHQPDTPPVRADLGLGTAIEHGPLKTWREARRRAPGHSLGAYRAAAVDTVSMHYAAGLIDDPRLRFFAQSYFAQGFAREVLERDAMIITDPIRVVDVKHEARRHNTVLYNVVKSGTMIAAVQALLPDVEFRPIEKMSFAEVAQALSEGTVYLELGHLPGRDRMSREAAHFGTPVVVLARGAGYCWQDFPLPVGYRIPFQEGWPVQAAAAVRRVLDDPDQAIRDQQSYREWVAGERERYEEAMDRWADAALG